MTVRVQLTLPAQSWWKNFIMNSVLKTGIPGVIGINEALEPYHARCFSPNGIEFDDEKYYTWFVLKWS